MRRKYKKLGLGVLGSVFLIGVGSSITSWIFPEISLVWYPLFIPFVLLLGIIGLWIYVGIPVIALGMLVMGFNALASWIKTGLPNESRGEARRQRVSIPYLILAIFSTSLLGLGIWLIAPWVIHTIHWSNYPLFIILGVLGIGMVSVLPVASWCATFYEGHL